MAIRRVLPLVIILFAFALRSYNLTYHSLWFDEAVSVYWAKQTVPRILEVGFSLVEDRLPPLYYLMLKGGIALFGLSEFGVRILSVFFGVLLVPVMMSLATKLFNHRVALTMGGLIAVNPFLIWYSQEARMYAPATLFATLTVWSFLKILPTPYSLLLTILFATAALYSHLYAGFLLPALGLWLLLSYPRQWKLWLIFSGCGLVITLAYAPILWAIWRFSGESTPGTFSGIGQRAWWLLQAFTIWKAPLADYLKLAIPLTIGGFALFQIPPSKIHNPQSTIPRPTLLVSFLLIVPFLIANGLLMRNHLAFFGERYFIIMTPWLLLLAAVGAENFGKLIYRFLKTYNIFPLFLIMMSLLALPGQWSPAAAKEAWRQSAAYLATHATSNDAILIHPDWIRYPFQFYFRGTGQTYAAFSNVNIQTDLTGPLNGVIKNHAVIWLIQSHLDEPDPQHRVEQWLATRYPLITELYPTGIALKGYALAYQLPHLPATARPSQCQFSAGLSLLGYEAETVVSATDELFHPPSGWLHVTLYWTAHSSVAEPIIPFVHLVGAAGAWGINLDRPTDSLKLYPPTRWTKGQVIRHDVDVNLNPATPAGQYQLIVGVASQTCPLSTILVK